MAFLAPFYYAGSSSSGGGIPSWASALRDLVSDPTDFLFGYNFAAGGTGQGWNNVTEQLLTVGQALHAPATFGTWSTALIIDGLGLAQDDSNFGETFVGILPASTQNGVTLLIEARTYVPVTGTTSALCRTHLVEADDNFDGGCDLYFIGGGDFNKMEVTNLNGSSDASDTITPKATAIRGVSNVAVDGSAVVGSINGRPVVIGTGSVATMLTPTVYAANRDLSGTDVPVYVTLMAVFNLQLSAQLPSMSTLL